MFGVVFRILKICPAEGALFQGFNIRLLSFLPFLDIHLHAGFIVLI